MVNCLRGAFLYAEKRARDMLFEALEPILGDDNCRRCPLIVSRLTREAANRARCAAQFAGYDFNNWDTAGKAVINAMLRAGVLLTRNNSPIPPDITGQATEVAALKDGYRDTTEAYLLEFIIRELGDVTIRDHTPLAHALFRQFDPNVPMDDLEDRVVLLMARLTDRVVLNASGTYVVRESPQPALFEM